MKKLSLFLVSLSLLLSACSVGNITKKEEVIQENTKEKSVIPKYSISGDYYRTIIPLKEQKMINSVNVQTNSKLDINEFETGLMNIALKQFDTKNHYLQRNQYIPEKTIKEIVTKQEIPLVSNIIEHDYFTKKNSEELSLAGIVIGLAIPSNYSNEEALSKGNEVANQLLKAIHDNKDFTKTPITFAIFKQENMTSLKSGTFISNVTVPKNESKVGSWSNIKEESFVYPSEEFQKAKEADYKMLDKFANEVKKFSPKDYIPINAKISYNNDHINKLNIDTIIKYNGKSEITAFTQVITQNMLDVLPKDIKIQIQIKSDDGIEAIIIKEKNEDKPFVSFT
ncbi:CamS family sex pheromone protein [Bacillus pseudomycoides]|uniref:CamS family sex pheromone protein n=1 Tax=Bacillus bingmayongensis TaxID=1150157 RepID=A0ABU5K4C4_9BACI|nr:CamS family sex pheromone protein [Bacillus pseudomycoides]